MRGFLGKLLNLFKAETKEKSCNGARKLQTNVIKNTPSIKWSEKINIVKLGSNKKGRDAIKKIRT